MIVEFIGYLASVLVALSLLMSNVRRLRIINLAGAMVFAVYGVLISSWPVFAVNAFIVVVNLVFLWKLSRRHDAFSFFAARADSGFLREFLSFWREDIRKFFPDFDLERIEEPRARLILRNLNPVGVFIWRDAGKGVAEILIDYVVPGFRDFRNAHFLFSGHAGEFDGFDTFQARTWHPLHRKYLKRLGFVEDPGEAGVFTRSISGRDS